MRTSPLRLLALCALGASLFAVGGCGSSQVSAGSFGMSAPQTGSNIGRRLPLHGQGRTAATPPREKVKRQKPKAERPPKQQRADDDYMTRGGFR